MITSASNPRIKEVRKLQRRRARYEQQRVLIEGVRLVQDAWQTGATLHELFYAPELLQENAAVATLVEQLAVGGVETVPCSAAVFATLSETVTPQGVAATVSLPQLPVPAPCPLLLLLDLVRDPGNAGTLLRSAAAAGVGLVLFGPGTVDPFNEKVMRAGMGAHFRTPIRVLEEWAELASWLQPERPLYLAEAQGELAYDEVDWTQHATLVVGGEAEGASAWIRQRATPIRIPMERATESLNAAVAGSVILFEGARQRRWAEKRAATRGAR